MLLNSLLQYDIVKTTKGASLPQLLVIITGKGPEKEMYLKQIENIHWENVVILTAWLEAEEYPLVSSVRVNKNKFSELSAIVLCPCWCLSSHLNVRLFYR